MYKDLCYKVRLLGHTRQHAAAHARTHSLMTPLVMQSLSALVAEYRRRYEEVFHELVKVYIGYTRMRPCIKLHAFVAVLTTLSACVCATTDPWLLQVPVLT